MNKIKVASVQFNHKSGDKNYNLARIRTFVSQAVKENVELIIFPEMCITGYWHVRKLSKQEVALLSEQIPQGPSTQELVTLATENNVSIGAGLIEKSESGELYNTYVVALPNGQVVFHRKLHDYRSLW